jgi:hypothetical protein
MTTVLIRAAQTDVSEVPLPARGAAGTGDALLPDDIVDQWGLQSFPASDPPANW